MLWGPSSWPPQYLFATVDALVQKGWSTGLSRGWFFGRALGPTGPNLIPSEELAGLGAHVCHGGKDSSVVVARVPKEEPDSALVLGHADLRANVGRRVAWGAPSESLQPGTQ